MKKIVNLNLTKECCSGVEKRLLKSLIGPSILNADLSNLSAECIDLINCGADYLHLDVMDGHFVNNLTFGHPVVKCLRQHVKEAFFDMHMMVSAPEKWIADIADAGANQYTFHLEATEDPSGCIRKIKESGMKVGLSIRPCTPVEKLIPFINEIDMALIMTVQPGKG
jgi:ribulose-phosphate 3-epimerase